MMVSCSSARRLPTQRWMPKPNERCWRGSGAVDDVGVRVVDHLVVAVAGDVPHHHPVALADGLAAELEVLRGDAAPCGPAGSASGWSRRPSRGSASGLARSLAYWSGLRFSAKIEPEMVFRVVSLPPMISRVDVREVLVHRRVAGVRRRAPASRSGRRPAGRSPARSTAARSSRGSRPAAGARSVVGVPPGRGPARWSWCRTTGQLAPLLEREVEQRGQRHRGQLLGDQVDPVERLADRQANPGSRRPARGSPGPSRARLAGATTGLTVLRCTSWLGGSMLMKLLVSLRRGRSRAR